MKNTTCSLSTAVIAAAIALTGLASAQDMSCTRTPGHDVCQFDDGSVIETFSDTTHYKQFHWTAEEWFDQKCERSPSSKVCVADRQSHIKSCLTDSGDSWGMTACTNIHNNCTSKHSKFTKVECTKIETFLNTPVVPLPGVCNSDLDPGSPACVALTKTKQGAKNLSDDVPK